MVYRSIPYTHVHNACTYKHTHTHPHPPPTHTPTHTHIYPHTCTHTTHPHTYSTHTHITHTHKSPTLTGQLIEDFAGGSIGLAVGGAGGGVFPGQGRGGQDVLLLPLGLLGPQARLPGRLQQGPLGEMSEMIEADHPNYQCTGLKTN